MSKPDIFAELNEVLSKPNLGRGKTLPEQKDHAPASDQHADRPTAQDVRRLGYELATLLYSAGQVGPLAAPTRARDHRFRAELSMLFDPNAHHDVCRGAKT